MTKNIDWTKPIELIDGTPATFLRKSGVAYVIRIDGPVKHNGTPYAAGTQGFYYKEDGSRYYSNDGFPAVRNRATALDTTKQLQTVDGKSVSFLGKMEDGRIVVSVAYQTWTGQPATELRFADGRKSNLSGVTSGDDVIVKIVRTERFRNVYADGTLGTAAHATEADAKLRSQYGKVRVGLFHQTLEDGKVAKARVIHTEPWFRSGSVRGGRAALPSDY